MYRAELRRAGAGAAIPHRETDRKPGRTASLPIRFAAKRGAPCIRPTRVNPFVPENLT